MRILTEEEEPEVEGRLVDLRMKRLRQVARYGSTAGLTVLFDAIVHTQLFEEGSPGNLFEGFPAETPLYYLSKFPISIAATIAGDVVEERFKLPSPLVSGTLFALGMGAWYGLIRPVFPGALFALLMGVNHFADNALANLITKGLIE